MTNFVSVVKHRVGMSEIDAATVGILGTLDPTAGVHGK
jgi:hypothetical protein